MYTHTLGIQIRTVLSRDAEANSWPEGENWTDMTASWNNIDSLKWGIPIAWEITAQIKCFKMIN